MIVHVNKTRVAIKRAHTSNSYMFEYVHTYVLK